jgi:hypothetical protein
MPLCSNRDVAAEAAGDLQEGDLQEGAKGGDGRLRPGTLVRMVWGLVRLKDRRQAETDDLRPRTLVRVVGGLVRLEVRWQAETVRVRRALVRLEDRRQAETEDLRADFQQRSRGGGRPLARMVGRLVRLNNRSQAERPTIFVRTSRGRSLSCKTVSQTLKHARSWRHSEGTVILLCTVPLRHIVEATVIGQCLFHAPRTTSLTQH